MDRSISYALEKIACSSIVLKAEQAPCIKYIYEGKDVFLWLPTGFGKSLCYEVLPFVFDDKLGKDNSVAIIVSPLISLMVDQVQSLRRRSIRAAIMSSGSKVDIVIMGRLTVLIRHLTTPTLKHVVRLPLIKRMRERCVPGSFFPLPLEPGYEASYKQEINREIADKNGC